MWTLTKQLGITGLTVLGLLGFGDRAAHGQLRVNPNSQSLVNPYFRVAPGLPLNQAAYNTAVMGRALQQVPPWAFGYNPYRSPIVSPFPSPYYTCLGFCNGPLPFNSALSTGAFGGGYGATGTLFSAGGGFGAYGGSLSSNIYGMGGFSGGYGGWGGGWGGLYMPDPFAGYMSGAAQVISSQSQFMTSQAQADVTREQTRQMRIDTHRKILEEWQYERNLLANVPDPRIQEQKFALNRALNDPPLTEVLTGDALNAILNNIVKLQDKGAVAPQVPLDEEMLKSLNVSDGEPGNIGLLRNGGKLSWPSSLQGAPFDEERKRLTQLAQDAVERVKFNGQVDPGTLQQMRKDARAMHERLNENIRDLTPTQYVDAKRYLNQLDEALRALDNKKVQNHFNGKWTPKAKTANELVKEMKDAGLRFNGATRGDEAAYRMVQQRLAALNFALESQTGAAPPPK